MEVKKDVGGPSSSRLIRNRTREAEGRQGSSVVNRGVIKFGCQEPGCDKSYVSKASLKRHKEDTHGPKEVCKGCGVTTTKSYMWKHVKRCKKVVDQDDDESDSDSEDEIKKMGSELLKIIDV